MLEAKASDAAQAAPPGEAAGRARLRGWKEIGRHFGVDERTAKRWESQRGLPVHRLPGEARAPVFAFADELDAWVARDQRAPDASAASVPPKGRSAGRRPWVLLALLLVAVVAALWFGQRAAQGERVASERTDALARLATAQLAALNDQLDSPPGTVAVRAELAAEAVTVLDRVAALPGADAQLRRQAAEGWRRLAILQNAIDRPSLRDRPAARESLAKGLALLDGDDSVSARDISARVQLEAARQAGGAGDLAEAERLLAKTAPTQTANPADDLAQEWWLVRAEISSWAGDHEAAREAAARVGDVEAGDPLATLRQLKARDLEAEARYYLGDLPGARATYERALAAARSGVDRWPTDSRLRWALLRQQWNLGSTLVTMGEARAAVPLLAQALAGWEALARADPSDGAVAAWVRAVRLSHGQALQAAGDGPAAIGVLSQVLAERRQWLDLRPDDGDRRRMLVKGLATLGDALVPMGRIAEACALYAEADTLADRMARDGQLTGYDRAETLRLLAAALASHCPGKP